jgi:hypothetical protein
MKFDGPSSMLRRHAAPIMPCSAVQTLFLDMGAISVIADTSKPPRFKSSSCIASHI